MKSKASLWWFLLFTLCVCLGVVVFNANWHPGNSAGSKSASTTSPTAKSSQALPPTTAQSQTAVSGSVPAVDKPAAPVLAQSAPPAPIFERAVIASGWREPTSPKLAAFVGWTDRYTAAAPADRPALVAEGVALAKDRRAQMLDLIVNDPRAALVAAVPLVVRGQMPTAVLDELEKRVSGEGDLYRVAGMPGPAMDVVIPTVETAKVNGDYYTSHRYGVREQTAFIRDGSIQGVAVGKELAVSDSPIRQVEPGEDTPTTPGAQCNVAGVTPTTATANQPGLTSYQIGNQFNTTCCPYCTTHLTALETRLRNAEAAGVPLAQVLQDPIMSLGDGGVTGTAGNYNKPPVSWTNGPKKLIFMRVDFTDKAWPSNEVDPNTGYDMSVNGLNNQVTKPDGMMARTLRMSYGLSSISSAAITPVMHLPKATSDYWVQSEGGDCSRYWGPIQNDAQAAATALGYKMSDYVCYIVVHPNFINNGAAAWGGGGDIWCNGYVDAKVLQHEYGHVFWLPHANSYTTTDGNVLSSARQHVEYGDAADTMGNAWGSNLYNDFNAYFKSFCNWLPDSTVQTVTHNGTYRLYQNDGTVGTPSPRVLKINRNGAYDWWLMYRGTPIPQNLFNQGVSILEVTPNVMPSNGSHILDMNDPSGDTSNAPLSQGQVFSDPTDGITITNAGRGGVGNNQYIYVKVAFSPTRNIGSRPIVNGGIYRLRNKYYNQYLSAPSNTTTAGALLALAASGTGDFQKWVAHRNADGTYSFNHLNTDQWIDVSGNSGNDYATLGQYYSNGVDGQCWIAMPTDDGYVEFRHRNTNEVFCADRANNGNMIQYGEYGGDEQHWMPELVGVTEGTYKLSPHHAPSLVLDLSNRGVASGGQVQTAIPNGARSQLWTVKYSGTTGQFRLINAAVPTRSVGLSNGAGSTNGAQVVVADSTGANDQLLTFTAVGSNWVRFAPVNAPSSTFDVLNQNTAPGTGLVLGSVNSNLSQQFQFLDADQ